MIDYKFKVGDMVRILKIDKYSIETMKQNIGKIGTIISRDIDGYTVKLDSENDKFSWYYEEDSLEFVNEKMINKHDVLAILYETKESGIFNHGTICDLIRRVRELPCK